MENRGRSWLRPSYQLSDIYQIKVENLRRSFSVLENRQNFVFRTLSLHKKCFTKSFQQFIEFDSNFCWYLRQLYTKWAKDAFLVAFLMKNGMNLKNDELKN